ncbi:MAG: hypothetical protein Q4G51_02905 [Dermatophilus congolensis]|nr:hypothetical protein [Dermatophilus congolensis]
MTISSETAGTHTLLAAEKELVAAVERGETFDLAAFAARQPADDGLAVHVRAEVIRDILLGRYPRYPDPRGLMLTNGAIIGRIDLDHTDIGLPIRLHRCTLADGVSARHAHLNLLDLTACKVGNWVDPERSPVDLDGCTISEDLSLPGADLHNSGAGPALDARNATILGPVHLGVHQGERLTARSSSREGTIDFVNARLGDRFEASGALLTNDRGPALDARSVRVERDLRLDAWNPYTDQWSSTEEMLAGAEPYLGRRMGRWAAADAVAATPPGTIPFEATGAGPDGTIRLNEADLGGRVTIARAVLTNVRRAEAVEHDGVRRGGPALSIVNTRIGQSLRAMRLVAENSSATQATVRLRDTTVGGHVTFTRARLTNRLPVPEPPAAPSPDTEYGPVLHANRMTTARGLLLYGAVFNDRQPPDSDRRGRKLTGQDAMAGRTAYTVELAGVRIGGEFGLALPRHENATPGGATWLLDGLTFRGATPTGVTLRYWIRFLRDRMPAYRAQPYQHTANASKATGHDAETAEVLIAQRDHQLVDGNLTRGQRTWARFTRATLNYGYSPSRALAGVVVSLVLLIGSLVLLPPTSLRADGDLNSAASVCSTNGRIAYVVNSAIPLARITPTCVATDTPEGTQLLVVSLIAQLLSWAALTLFVAGYTSIVRKP